MVWITNYPEEENEERYLDLPKNKALVEVNGARLVIQIEDWDYPLVLDLKEMIDFLTEE